MEFFILVFYNILVSFYYEIGFIQYFRGLVVASDANSNTN